METLGLIGDMADCCGKDIKAQVQKPFVEKMIQVCSRDDQSNESRQAAEWALEKIKEIMQA